MGDGEGRVEDAERPVSGSYVPTDAHTWEAPPGERRSWPSLQAWLADPVHYWFPEAS